MVKRYSLTGGLILFVSCLCMGEEFGPIPFDQEKTLSLHSQQIVSALLQEMGLNYPDDDKQIPKPSPEPAPIPSIDDSEFFDDDFFDQDLSFDDTKKAMESSFNNTVDSWNTEYQKTLERWEKARVEFLQVEQKYRDTTPSVNTFRLGSGVETKSYADQHGLTFFSQMEAGDFHVIPRVMDIPTRNQMFRGTCNAFASVRAIEAILIQNEVQADFSEQFYYWMAKPECASNPCTDKSSGSSIYMGLLAALSPKDKRKKRELFRLANQYSFTLTDDYWARINQTGLMSEPECPYVAEGNKNNETMTPLRHCRATKGGLFVNAFSILQSDTDIVPALLANKPVISGFKLSSNFNKGQGLVTYQDRNKYYDSSKHDGGHAVLLVGLIKLPASLRQEGEYCAIVSNSWGDGWGKGGYGCLTEKWIKQYQMHHIALEAVIQ